MIWNLIDPSNAFINVSLGGGHGQIEGLKEDCRVLCHRCAIRFFRGRSQFYKTSVSLGGSGRRYKARTCDPLIKGQFIKLLS